MNKLISRSISVFVAFALTFGGYYSAQALSVVAALTSANSYYVSATGNDSNPGTLAAPFSTISKGMSVAQAGDSVYVRAGTYPAFSVAKSGLTVAGYNSEMPLVSGGAGIRCYNKSDITIKGFEVTGASGNYIGAIMLDNCSNVFVTGNKVHDNIAATVSGILISGSNNRVLNNEVYNNNFSGIRVFGTSLNNEIGFNRAHNQTLSTGNSDGIDIADPTVTQTNIHDNTVFGNSDDGIDTWTSPGNTITNNVSYGNGGTGDGNGFKLGGNTTGGNNTVIGNISYSNKTTGFTSNGNGDYFERNTSYNNGTSGFSDIMRNAGNTQTSSFINNVAYNNPGGNFKKNPTYTTVFVGNSETPPIANATPSAIPTMTSIASVTPTLTSAPTLTPTVTLTLPVATITSSPVPASPTSTQISNPPTTAPTATQIAASPTVPPTSTPPTVAPTTTLLSASPTILPSNIPPTIAPTATSVVVNSPASATVFDDKNNGFTYSPGWQEISKKQAYRHAYKLTNQNGSFVKFTFTGQSFSILYKADPTFGKIDVYVDNILVGTIKEFMTTPTFQRRWDYSGQLASGSHTLQLVFVTADTSGNTGGSIDAVIVR